mgnify:FL=1
MYVKLVVDIPKNLTKEQKEKVKAMGESIKETQYDSVRGFNKK